MSKVVKAYRTATLDDIDVAVFIPSRFKMFFVNRPFKIQVVLINRSGEFKRIRVTLKISGPFLRGWSIYLLKDKNIILKPHKSLPLFDNKILVPYEGRHVIMIEIKKYGSPTVLRSSVGLIEIHNPYKYIIYFAITFLAAFLATIIAEFIISTAK